MNRLIWMLLLFSTASALAAETITVFAAASLTDSLREIGDAYQQRTRKRIVFNFAGSSTLARQIDAGAPADIFFSADEAKMDWLEMRGLVVTNSRRSCLGNVLVVVVASAEGAAVHRPEDLAMPWVKRIALADPKAVPAGMYARAWLEGRDLWTEVAPKVVPTENVRAALSAVEAGNADAAVIYRTDAVISKKVRVAVTVPRGEGPAIRYPVARLRESRQPEAAQAFLDFLTGAEAQRVFARHGFIVFHPAPDG